MSQAQLVAGSDRLPWLTDDIKSKRRAVARDRKLRLCLAVVVAFVVLAGLSYWMGQRSWRLPERGIPYFPRSTTIQLPPAIAPQPEVKVAPAPAVTRPSQPVLRQAPQREVRIANRETASSAPPDRDESAAGEVGSPTLEVPDTSPGPPVAPVLAPKKTAPVMSVANPPARPMSPIRYPPRPRATRPALSRTEPLTVWPARVSNGASGRLVQIGAFGSRLQAKQGWRAMVRAYPAVSHLQAVVVETRNSRGRNFYRFQIGTTSQAHSEVLCQRMEKISFSCAVVGLPWKPKGVER